MKYKRKPLIALVDLKKGMRFVIASRNQVIELHHKKDNVLWFYNQTTKELIETTYKHLLQHLWRESFIPQGFDL